VRGTKETELSESEVRSGKDPGDIAIPGVIPENLSIHHEKLVNAFTPYGEWARSLSPRQAQALRDRARTLLRENARLFERASRNPPHSVAALAALNSDNPLALIELYEVIKFG